MVGLVGALLTALVVGVSSAPAFGDSGCPTAVAATLVSGNYEIDTPAKLQWLKDTGSKSSNYKLTADVNMTGCTWSTGIGSGATPFSGVFDGNSKTISNLTISGSAYVGLFSYLSGSVSNLTLMSPSITVSSQFAAALVGDLKSGGSVSNITVTNVSVSTVQGYSGGVVAYSRAGSTVDNVTVSGTVSSPAGVGGGVVATAEGSLTNLTSSVTVTGSFNLGGLAGSVNNSGSVSNSSASGSVTGSSSQVGGAVGSAAGTSPTCGTITNVTASGTVQASIYAGGVLGYGNCYFIYRSSSSSTVTASSNHAGGIVGYDNFPGRVEKSYFTGSVTATESVGGIAGLSRSVIVDSWSSGSVTATSSTNGGRAGGLVGWFRNTGGAYPNAEITRSYARGAVTPPSGGSSTVGGLVGDYSSGTITSGLWDTQTTGQSTSQGTGAKGYTSQQLKDYVLYDADNLNWDVTDGISSGNGVSTGTFWSVCSGANSGYPFLTRQGLSGTCRPTMAYNGNGNTGGSAPSDGSTPYTAGDTVTVLGNTGTLTKTSAVFTGWNTKADGSGMAYTSSDTFTINAPVMLFAQWASSQSITYNSNGGTGSISATTGVSGTTVTLSSGSGFSRTGYVLSRWDTTSAGTGTSYSKSQSITMPGGGLTLYAVWTANATTTTAPSTTTTVPSTTTTVSGSTTTVSGATSTTSPALAGSGGSGGGVVDPVVTTLPNGPVIPGTSTTVVSTATTVKNTGGGTATTSPAGGATVGSSTTTTEAASQAGGQDDADVPDVDGVGPGQVGATVNGAPVVATVEESGGSLVVKVGGLLLRYTLTSPDGLRRTVSSASALQVFAGDALQVDFEGFGNDGTAQAWLVPGNTQIGRTVLTNGRGSVRGTVPTDASSGPRRIVTRAETPMGEPVVVAYGVTVTNTGTGSSPWSRILLVVVGLAILSGLLIPAARRRRQEEN